MNGINHNLNQNLTFLMGNLTENGQNIIGSKKKIAMEIHYNLLHISVKYHLIIAVDNSKVTVGPVAKKLL